MKKIILTLIFVVILHFEGLAQFESWQVIGEMTNPVSRGQAVVYKDRIYIFGGYSDISQNPVNWIQEYNPSTNTWKIVGHMSAEREGLLAFVQDTSIILIGGIEKNSSYLNSIEEWNPNIADSTAKVIGSNTNFDRIYPTGLSYNNELFIFGGYPFATTNQSLTYFTKYSFTNSSFTDASNFIYSNGDFPSQQMSELFTSSIYVFGGAKFGILRSIYEYKLTTNQYIKLNIQLNETRAGGVAIKHQIYKLIYIIGGFDEGSGALSTVEIFRPLEEGGGILFEGPELNYKRKNLMAVFYNKTFYVFGGEDSNGKLVPYVEKLAPDATTVAEGLQTLPVNVSLKQNYPNPFNPTTVIGYELSQQSFINLKIFDVLGKEIKELINEYKQPGYHEVQFNAKDLSSGVYYYQLKAGNFSETKKMVVVK